MKKIVVFSLLCMLLIGMLPLSAVAANNTYILEQPQNYVYNEGAVAIYYVTAAGEHLQCTWYLEFDGKTYNLSEPGATSPWINYVGAECGSSEMKNNLDYFVPHTTFCYFFNDCEAGLNGAYIYAEIYDGWDTVTSTKALIQLSAGVKSPPQVSVPAAVEVTQGDELVLTCTATAVYDGELSYTWYETPDGDLTKIRAINRGEETNATLVCDTSSYGTYYYVCAVGEKNGGSAYSSVITVNVLEKQSVQSTNLSPLQVYYHDSEGRKVELLKATDSNRKVTVDLTDLKDSVSGGLVHFVTYTDPLTEQEDLVTFSSSNTDIYDRFSVQKVGYDKADEVLILFNKTGSTTITAKLPNGKTQSVEVTVVESSELDETFRIIFDANGGTGTMEDVILTGTNKYTLPDCTFTEPEGKMFDGWSFDGEVWWPGNEIGLQGTPTTVTALWADLPYDHICNAEKVDKVEPTETTPGKEAYYVCPGCKNAYEDVEATKLITDLENWGIIDPLGSGSADEPTNPAEDETKPNQDDSNPAEDETKPNQDDSNERNEDENTGIPWWIVLLGVVFLSAAGVCVTLLVLNKKKAQKE